MQGKGLSPKTIKNVHGFLYSIMGTAFYRGYRPANPCEHIGYLFLVGTGLRFSKATTLQPEDFSDEGGRYTVRVTKAWKRDDKNGRTIGAAKTERARRTVPMDPALASAVGLQVSTCEPCRYVFTMEEGGEAATLAMHNKAWKPAVRAAQAAGLKKSPRIHDLRHTYGSWMLGGEDLMMIFDLFRLMGHEFVNTTMKVYSHLMPEALGKSAGANGRAMNGLSDIKTAKGAGTRTATRHIAIEHEKTPARRWGSFLFPD